MELKVKNFFIVFIFAISFSKIALGNNCQTENQEVPGQPLNSADTTSRTANQLICNSEQVKDNRDSICNCINNDDATAEDIEKIKPIFSKKMYLGLGDLIKQRLYQLIKDVALLEGNVSLQEQRRLMKSCTLDKLSAVSCNGNGNEVNQNILNSIFGDNVKINDVKSEMQKLFLDQVKLPNQSNPTINSCFSKKEFNDYNLESPIDGANNQVTDLKESIIDNFSFFTSIKNEFYENLNSNNTLIDVSGNISNTFSEIRKSHTIEESFKIDNIEKFFNSYPPLRIALENPELMGIILEKIDKIKKSGQTDFDFYNLFNDETNTPEAKKVKNKFAQTLQARCDKTFEQIKFTLCHTPAQFENTSVKNDVSFLHNMVERTDSRTRKLSRSAKKPYEILFCQFPLVDAERNGPNNSEFDKCVAQLNDGLPFFDRVPLKEQTLAKENTKFEAFSADPKYQSLCKLVIRPENCTENCTREDWSKVWDTSCVPENRSDKLPECSNDIFKKFVEIDRRKHHNISINHVLASTAQGNGGQVPSGSVSGLGNIENGNGSSGSGVVSSAGSTIALGPVSSENGNTNNKEGELSDFAKQFYGTTTVTDQNSEQAKIEQTLGLGSVPALNMEFHVPENSGGQNNGAGVGTVLSEAAPQQNNSGPQNAPAPVAANPNGGRTAGPNNAIAVVPANSGSGASESVVPQRGSVTHAAGTLTVTENPSTQGRANTSSPVQSDSSSGNQDVSYVPRRRNLPSTSQSPSVRSPYESVVNHDFGTINNVTNNTNYTLPFASDRRNSDYVYATPLPDVIPEPGRSLDEIRYASDKVYGAVRAPKSAPIETAQQKKEREQQEIYNQREKLAKERIEGSDEDLEGPNVDESNVAENDLNQEIGQDGSQETLSNNESEGSRTPAGSNEDGEKLAAKDGKATSGRQAVRSGTTSSGRGGNASGNSGGNLSTEASGENLSENGNSNLAGRAAVGIPLDEIGAEGKARVLESIVGKTIKKNRTVPITLPVTLGNGEVRNYTFKLKYDKTEGGVKVFKIIDWDQDFTQLDQIIAQINSDSSTGIRLIYRNRNY